MRIRVEGPAGSPLDESGSAGLDDHDERAVRRHGRCAGRVDARNPRYADAEGDDPHRPVAAGEDGRPVVRKRGILHALRGGGRADDLTGAGVCDDNASAFRDAHRRAATEHGRQQRLSHVDDTANA